MEASGSPRFLPPIFINPKEAGNFCWREAHRTASAITVLEAQYPRLARSGHVVSSDLSSMLFRKLENDPGKLNALSLRIGGRALIEPVFQYDRLIAPSAR